MRPHLSEARAQFCLAFPGPWTNGLLQLPEIAEKVGMCLVKGLGEFFFRCFHGHHPF
jgi:hypothetical protein